MFPLSLVYLYFLFIFLFGFKSGIWLLIAPVPVLFYNLRSPRCVIKDLNFKKLKIGQKLTFFMAKKNFEYGFCISRGDNP